MTNDFEIDGNGSSPTYSGDQDDDDDDKALRSSLHHMHLLCKGEKRFSSDTQHQHQPQKQRDRPANTYNDNCYTGPIYVLYSRSSSLCTARHIACQPMLMMMMTLCYAVCYVPGKSAMKTKVNIDARRTKMR